VVQTYKIQVLPGDGIGPETIAEAVKVLTAVAEKTTGLDFDFHEFPSGGKYFLETGEEWPVAAKEFASHEADAILLGAVGWETAPGKPIRRMDGNIAGAAVVLEQRRDLELYANVRPVKLYDGIPTPLIEVKPKDLDFVIIRENTEGLYSGIGGFVRKDEPDELAIDARLISRLGAERVIRYAFELSTKRKKGAPHDGQRKVTCVDKSNVLKGCQLFREVFQQVANDYSDIQSEYAYVDAFAMWMVRNPQFFDVAVTPNMFGDILSDLGAAIQGGLGVAPGANIGKDHAMFEPIHGSAPRHAGKQRANPIAAILAGKLMLDWLGEKHQDRKSQEAADLIEKSVKMVLKEGRIRTYDLCIGQYSKITPSTTAQVGDAIVNMLERS
jgi:3-isopropylmalate dehydrogenase